jgi:hypothetical protein
MSHIIEKHGNFGFGCDDPLTAKVVVDNQKEAAIDVRGGKIIGVQDPSSAQDAATKLYVDTQVGGEQANVPQVMFTHMQSSDDSISIDLNTITDVIDIKGQQAVNGDTIAPNLHSSDNSISLDLNTITHIIDVKGQKPIKGEDIAPNLHSSDNSISLDLNTITHTIDVKAAVGGVGLVPVRVPHMTTTERNGVPTVLGELIVDTTVNALMVFDGSGWTIVTQFMSP